MLEIQIPNNKSTIARQIKALKGLIKTDNDKDREYHYSALQQLEKAYEAI